MPWAVLRAERSRARMQHNHGAWQSRVDTVFEGATDMLLGCFLRSLQPQAFMLCQVLSSNKFGWTLNTSAGRRPLPLAEQLSVRRRAALQLISGRSEKSFVKPRLLRPREAH